MFPLVSVNIATYNSEKTLVKCLDSIKEQTYKNIEIIIMDSYSKDKTLDIAKSYGTKIVFAPTLATARKAGADVSQGDYIFILDYTTFSNQAASKYFSLTFSQFTTFHHASIKSARLFWYFK